MSSKAIFSSNGVFRHLVIILKKIDLLLKKKLTETRSAFEAWQAAQHPRRAAEAATSPEHPTASAA
jgi:hypothetical protein